MLQPVVVACDIGGTKSIVGLVNDVGEIIARKKYVLGDRTLPEQVVGDIDKVMSELLEETGLQRSDVLGVGCGTNGVVDRTRTVVTMNHNIGWYTPVAFTALLSEQLSLPVVLEMDAVAAALGEAWCGSARDYDSFVLVIVGTGVGAGMIIDGRPVFGSHGTAGEFGHMVVVPDGPMCGCGKHGCLEALASGLAIERRGRAAVRLGRQTYLSKRDTISAEAIAEAARQGDAVSREIIDEAAHYLGIGIANLITLLDPEAIVLGGGVGRGAFDIMEKRIKQAVQQHLNFWASRATPIRTSTLDENAGLLGAARAAFDRLPQTNKNTAQEV